jgi:hypothetical protein
MATKRTNPPQFNPDIYTKVTLNDLVLYSVYYLHKHGKEIAAEDLISACFVLFPRRFSLRKYPQWPDSAVVIRRWSDCKGKGYLRGNAVKGFQLTARGIKRAQKVEKSLGKPMKPVHVPKPKLQKPIASAQTVPPELRARARKYVRSIEMSEAYKHYKKGKPINEFDFRSLLLTTMESPPTTLTRNLGQFKEYVKIHGRKDLLTFLEFNEGKFSYLLNAGTQPAEKKAKK